MYLRVVIAATVQVLKRLHTATMVVCTAMNVA
jgi:hypothetical protein